MISSFNYWRTCLTSFEISKTERISSSCLRLIAEKITPVDVCHLVNDANLEIFSRVFCDFKGGRLLTFWKGVLWGGLLEHLEVPEWLQTGRWGNSQRKLGSSRKLCYYYTILEAGTALQPPEFLKDISSLWVNSGKRSPSQCKSKVSLADRKGLNKTIDETHLCNFE